MTTMIQDQAVAGMAMTPSRTTSSRYEWADVMLLPVNRNVLRIAQEVEHALTDMGISCGYLWSTPPSDVENHWGSVPDAVNWTDLVLPVDWHGKTVPYTIQMLRGLQQIQQHNLRNKFGVFVTFIDGGWSPRLLLLACERQGIPSVLIQEGMTLEQKRDMTLKPLRTRLIDVALALRARAAPKLFRRFEEGMHAQYNCVYGSMKAEALMTSGKPSETIFITGNPLFDTTTFKRIDAQPRSKTILYAHELIGTDVEAEVEWWRALVQASRNIGATLIFKVHPRAGLSADRIREMANIPDDSSVQLVMDRDIQDMVADAGVFVTACSASAYRALIEGVPLVVLSGVPAPYRIDLPDYGATLAVHKPDELTNVLHRALHNPQVRLHLQPGVDRAIERHLYRVDGQAAQRVAQAITSVLPYSSAGT